jgi:hypothetical protein
MGLAPELPWREGWCEGVRLLEDMAVLVLEFGVMVVSSVGMERVLCGWEQEAVCEESMRRSRRKIMCGKERPGGRLTWCVV